MQLLCGRSAIITGAAQGIGRAMVDSFIEQGATVLAVDIKPLDGLLDAYARPEGLHVLQLDITQPAAPERIMRAASERMGGLDILINNAGISSFIPITETSDSAWDEVLALNLSSVFRLCRDAVPLLKASSSGRIINIGSVMSTFGGAGLCAYAASKHGVAGLTKCLASELGEFAITANFIQPGAILTEITRGSIQQYPQMEAFWRDKAALGRWGEPSDIAPVAVFLASDLGAFVSGTGLVADGGAMQAP